MDNFLILLIIACAILWWDSKRRKKATRKAWKDIGADEYVEKDTIYKFPQLGPRVREIPKSPALTAEELMKILNSWQGIITQKQTDEEIIADLVNKVLTEIPSAEIADAKSALKALGYKDIDIKKAMGEITGTIKSDMKSGKIVTSALRILNA